MKYLLSLVFAAAAAVPADAVAIFNPANGHWYEYVSTRVTFADALAGASAATPIAGFQSYLATITSPEENGFVRGFVIVSDPARLAGSDAAVEGVWRWLAGPEAGQVIGYNNWVQGEPDNLNDEDSLILAKNSQWSDVPADDLYPYVVEYSPAIDAVAEPSTWAMMLLGFAAVGCAVGRSRRRSVGRSADTSSASRLSAC